MFSFKTVLLLFPFTILNGMENAHRSPHLSPKSSPRRPLAVNTGTNNLTLRLEEAKEEEAFSEFTTNLPESYDTKQQQARSKKLFATAFRIHCDQHPRTDNGEKYEDDPEEVVDMLRSLPTQERRKVYLRQEGFAADRRKAQLLKEFIHNCPSRCYTQLATDIHIHSICAFLKFINS